MNHTASIPALPTAYDLLNTRIQRIIHAPAAQQACQACISRLPGEDEGDWAHLLESFDRSNQGGRDPQGSGRFVRRGCSAAVTGLPRGRRAARLALFPSLPFHSLFAAIADSFPATGCPGRPRGCRYGRRRPWSGPARGL
ncbi:DUF1654 domain-containing protein [Pseudomonas aeruginosa]|nr:DUF1654 domain-containing protein [Pseudomonas aeruginosa]